MRIDDDDDDDDDNQGTSVRYHIADTRVAKEESLIDSTRRLPHSLSSSSRTCQAGRRREGEMTQDGRDQRQNDNTDVESKGQR